MISPVSKRNSGTTPWQSTASICAERAERYPLLHTYFQGDLDAKSAEENAPPELHPVRVPAGSTVIGLTVGPLPLPAIEVAALVRAGQKISGPVAEIIIRADDVLVLSGTAAAVLRAEQELNSTH